MEDDQQFCLRWNNHQSTLISVFDTLLENETLVDCTLAAEGKFLKAHKVVLSACSPYFATLLQEQYDKHPIFILKDVKYQELRAMMDYMYRGEVNISQDQLAALLKAAESLQIKGLSDNRTGGGSMPKHEQPQQHRGLGLPGAGLGGGKHVAGGGYTLEQTKRARMGPASIDSQELSGSREGSSSPTSRRRRKVRRRSIENAMADAHDNSNSSQIQPIATTSSLLQQQSNASLGGVSAITAAASALASQVPASAAAALPTAAAASTIATAATLTGTTQQQQMTAAATSVTKKTESAKGSSIIAAATGDVMHSELLANIDEQQQHAAGLELKSDKQNHKQQKSVLAKEAAAAAASSVAGAELVIEPKSEYDDEGNDENVEDLTLDDEDMGMEDLDHNAGTSHGNEGSSQGYAQWQHDRSQDEVFMATQEAQQRDPQVKHDKSEQTDISPDDFELDDCLLESNDIVITQNKDGFVLHVKKLGNITSAKIAAGEEEQDAATSAQAHITEVQDVTEVKPTLATLTTGQTIKLPSTECELINLKKIIPASTTIAHHSHATTTIIQPHQLHHPHHQQQQQHHQQQQQQHQLQIHDPHHQQQHEVQQQHIVSSGHPQTINLMSLRNVQITEQKPMLSRIKYSRGKIITQQGSSTPNVQIVEAHEQHQHEQHHELTDGTKYEISEIDLNNAQTSAAIISDLVKYAEIDDIELPDGTKIGIGFAPTEITEHMQQQTTHMEAVEPQQQQQQQQQHHHQQQHQLQIAPAQTHHHIQQQQQHQQQQLQQMEQDDEETIVPDGITVQEHPTITKSYTILTSRPMKLETGGGTTTTTYELSLSDSSLGQSDDIESKYVCRHCGKKYRWKSTLRRHESVECGGKEPCHPCPHCSYKAKQRGNLGVHVRKHHPDKPQLESKRGRKI